MHFWVNFGGAGGRDKAHGGLRIFRIRPGLFNTPGSPCGGAANLKGCAHCRRPSNWGGLQNEAREYILEVRKSDFRYLWMDFMS